MVVAVREVRRLYQIVAGGMGVSYPDMVLLLHIPGDGSKAYLVSMMQDGWVPCRGTVRRRSTPRSHGGVPLTIRTVEQLLDLRIDRVEVFSFSAPEGLRDPLGGVRVYDQLASSNLDPDRDYPWVWNQRAHLQAVSQQLL